MICKQIFKVVKVAVAIALSSRLPMLYNKRRYIIDWECKYGAAGRRTDERTKGAASKDLFHLERITPELLKQQWIIPFP
jgi:hypothetical protein